MHSLLTALPRQHHCTCPHSLACPVTAWLSRVPRLVAWLACSRGFPFSPAAVPVPMAQGMSCPELPMSFPALLLQGQHWGGFACFSSPKLDHLFIIFLMKALPLFLHPDPTRALCLGTEIPDTFRGCPGCRNSHPFVSQ